jgi:tRNA A-37 threonylcarbamoyl transferase component Bud32
MIATQRCPQCNAALAADAPEGLCPECLLSQAVDATGDWQNGDGPNSPPFAGFIAPRPGELAEHFPQLEILELLGQGGMGAVYKARQSKLDRMVALKILPPAWGKDPAFAERFSREARALAQLTHPNTIAVHDFGETGGFYYLIMEYVDGANLRHLLQSGPIGPREAVDIAAQVCDALQYAHEQGIIHRDIKPENILLDQRGRVKIADFGLAKLLGTVRPIFSLTGSRQVVGTPHYMAPEQMEKPHTVDHRADIYSLGVVFYEMLTGELPLGRFSLPSQKVRMDERLDHIVLRALEKDPERRYQRARQFRADLEMIAREAPPLPQVLAPGRYDQELEQELSRFRMSGPAAGLTLTGLAAFIFWTAMAIVGLVNILDHMARGVYREDFMLIVGLILIGAPVLILAAGVLGLAGRFLRRSERYEFVQMAALWAMVPWSPAVVIGLPVGIWVMVLLLRPEVRQAFARKAIQDRLGVAPPPLPPTPAPAPRPVHPLRRAVRSVVQGVLSLVFQSRAAGAIARPSGAIGPQDRGSPGAAWGDPAPAGAAAIPPGDRPRSSPKPYGGPGHAEPAWPGSKALPSGCSLRLLVVFGVFLFLGGVFLLAGLVYVSARSAPGTVYKPMGSSGSGGGAVKHSADLAEWQYPGSLQAGFGQSRFSRHARFTTPHDVEKVANWYERLTGARLVGGLGGHGAGSIGDLYYDYQDDSDPPPDGAIPRQPRPVTVRLLVARTNQATITVVISRAEAEKQTHIVVTWMQRY